MERPLKPPRPVIRWIPAALPLIALLFLHGQATAQTIESWTQDNIPGATFFVGGFDFGEAKGQVRLLPAGAPLGKGKRVSVKQWQDSYVIGKVPALKLGLYDLALKLPGSKADWVRLPGAFTVRNPKIAEISPWTLPPGRSMRFSVKEAETRFSVILQRDSTRYRLRPSRADDTVGCPLGPLGGFCTQTRWIRVPKNVPDGTYEVIIRTRYGESTQAPLVTISRGDQPAKPVALTARLNGKRVAGRDRHSTISPQGPFTYVRVRSGKGGSGPFLRLRLNGYTTTSTAPAQVDDVDLTYTTSEGTWQGTGSATIDEDNAGFLSGSFSGQLSLESGSGLSNISVTDGVLRVVRPGP